MKRNLPLVTRLLSWFLMWTALRSAYALYLGQSNTDYRLAWEAGFGPAVWVGEALYAFLATGAVVAIWTGARQTIALILACFAVSGSLLIFQLQQLEANPQRARDAYAESRRVRGFPVPDERLDTMFSASGRRLTWGIGVLYGLGPLVLLLARRKDLEHNGGDDE